ncbi:MAG: DUF4349 domain-containing protein [Firmicutes bacterium]|nr:DUF4349 domain-containing protein [Bacillota bacterium]
MSRHRRIKRLFIWFLVVFITTFFARWLFEIYFSGNDVSIQWNARIVKPTSEDFDSLSYSMGEKSAVRNIASEKYEKKNDAGKEIQVDQKYDKTAVMALHSENFEETNQGIRSLSEAHRAVIQMENLAGLEGSRTLLMTIGVVPDAFDALVDALRAQAELKSFTVNKVDKTDEYRKLMAEIETLEKTRGAYLSLQAQGGSLQDQLMLQEKLLEVEHSLQSIGASAGLYASENSFCTVHLSLTEVEPAAHTFSLARILRFAKSSFLWTVSACGLAAFILLALYAVAAATVWFSGIARGGAAIAPMKAGIRRNGKEEHGGEEEPE